MLTYGQKELVQASVALACVWVAIVAFFSLASGGGCLPLVLLMGGGLIATALTVAAVIALPRRWSAAYVAAFAVILAVVGQSDIGIGGLGGIVTLWTW